MRDIYKTAKKAQMAPVRGRVKAMMAQPRAVAQARKTARQTTGFQKGGHVKKASHKWTAEQFGGGEKGKPHSTQEGRIAAGERLFKRFWAKKKEEDKKRRMGPQAPARPKEAGMNVKKGGVMNYKKGGKVDKKWIQKAVNPKHKGYCTPMTKPTCTPARKRLAKLFKSKAKKGWANGGTVVMPTVGNDVRTRAYKHGALIHPRPKPTTVAHGRGVGIAKRGW